MALDIALTEPDALSAVGDGALATAMRRGPPTVLPLLVEMPTQEEALRERLPIPELAQAAAGIGHAHLELDRDGIARSVFLHEGIGTPNRPHFAMALLDCVPGAVPVALRGARSPYRADQPGRWVRDYQFLIPFIGPPGRFTTVSYVDVLRGSVPDAAIRGKLVLVGATAQGLGDAYPTPKSGESRAMPGVEVTASIVHGLQSGTLIRHAALPATIGLSVLPILLAFVGFLRCSPRRSLMLIVSLWVGSLALSVILLRMAAWWWPPVTAIAALTLVYPLWSWLRLEATQGFLDDEFARFASERLPLLGTELRPAGSTSGVVDAVQRRIDLARAATQRLRSARQLLSNTIKSLPESVLLVDTAGRIALANSAAASLFGVADAAELEGTAIDDHLYAATQAQELRFAALATTARCTLETHFGSPQRDLLVRAVAFNAGETVRVGTILSLTDISEMRAAQRERDDLVRFLSHDMKSPATSLLGLAHLQRDPTTALPHAQFFERLDVLAHRVLTLVDSFVSLARAESADPTAFEIFDLHDALQDACDEVWAAAKARSIAIKTDWPGEALFVNGDRQLLARAIVNLLANAIKFSPTRSSVRVRGERQADEAFVTVSDQGPGIAAAKCATLFERFSRHAHQGTDDPGGTGLGLAFVRVVAEKHRGRVWVDTDSAQGAILVLALPVVTDLPDRSRARY